MSEPRQEDTNPAGGESDALADALARIQELEARLRTVSAAYREKADEIERVKERLTRQAAAQDDIRRGEVVSAVFEPVENLSRSIQALKHLAPEALRGLEMVHGEFMSALQRLGLEEVEGVGARFDPAVHEAVASENVADPADDNRVVHVWSAGFRIGSRVIRPARVVTGSYQRGLGEA